MLLNDSLELLNKFIAEKFFGLIGHSWLFDDYSASIDHVLLAVSSHGILVELVIDISSSFGEVG